MKSAIILGGGPAGCQCALWLHLLGLDVLLVEQKSYLGGLQATSPYVNEWMAGIHQQTGEQFAENIQKHLTALKVPLQLETSINQLQIENDFFRVQIKNEWIKTKNIVIATGVKPRAGNFIKHPKILVGPGKNVFEYDFTNKRVAIFGGGDNAFENYLAIKNAAVCCHIYARHIRARQSFVTAADVKDIYSMPKKIDQQNLIVYQNNQHRHYDVMLVMYGWEANFPDNLVSYAETLTNKNGFVATKKNYETKIKSIYAIGEIANRTYPCVTTAMAEGVIVAKQIQEKLERKSY